MRHVGKYDFSKINSVNHRLCEEPMPSGRWQPVFTDSLCNDSWHTVSRGNIGGERFRSTRVSLARLPMSHRRGRERTPLTMLCVLSLRSHRDFGRKDDVCCGVDQKVTSFSVYRWQRVLGNHARKHRILEQTRSIAER